MPQRSPGSPLVSALITNHDYADYLPAAIESALGQTYPNVEVIVVDDGSEDSSRELIKGYGNRVKAVFQPAGGQAAALNTGFRASRGSLLCLLDADDVWHVEKVEQVVGALRAHPSAVLVYHRLQPAAAGLTPDGQPVPERLLRRSLARRALRSGGWWPFPSASALAFGRTFWASVGPIPDREFSICADAYLAGLAPLLGEVIGLEQPLGLYRLHGRNAWAHHPGSDDEQRTLRRYAASWEVRTHAVNAALERLGATQRLRLQDHWYYQRNQFQLGERQGRLRLSWLALRFPAEPSPVARIRHALEPWRVAGRRNLVG